MDTSYNIIVFSALNANNYLDVVINFCQIDGNVLLMATWWHPILIGLYYISEVFCHTVAYNQQFQKNLGELMQYARVKLFKLLSSKNISDPSLMWAVRKI